VGGAPAGAEAAGEAGDAKGGKGERTTGGRALVVLAGAADSIYACLVLPDVHARVISPRRDRSHRGGWAGTGTATPSAGDSDSGRDGGAAAVRASDSDLTYCLPDQPPRKGQ
jgi:hypothetical protein